MTDAGFMLVGLAVMTGVMLFSWMVVGPAAARQVREDQRKAKEASDAAWLAQVDEWNQTTPAPCRGCGTANGVHPPNCAYMAKLKAEHVHGAWCHPSADGCPDRPGM